MSLENESWRKIDSLQNPRFKTWEQALESRGLKKNGLFLLSGRKSVPEALEKYPGPFRAVLVDDPKMAEALALPRNIERIHLARPLFERLDVAGTEFPLLVGEVPEFGKADLALAPKGLELVCALGDPSNLGALLRSAASFGVRRVILLSESAHPFHPKALRAGANAQFELELLRGPGWEELNNAVKPIFALDADGEDISTMSLPRNMRLILGEEGKGIPASLQAKHLAIPMTGRVESLNATVAASLALYQYYVSARAPRGKART